MKQSILQKMIKEEYSKILNESKNPDAWKKISKLIIQFRKDFNILPPEAAQLIVDTLRDQGFKV